MLGELDKGESDNSVERESPLTDIVTSTFPSELGIGETIKEEEGGISAEREHDRGVGSYKTQNYSYESSELSDLGEEDSEAETDKMDFLEGDGGSVAESMLDLKALSEMTRYANSHAHSGDENGNAADESKNDLLHEDSLSNVEAVELTADGSNEKSAQLSGSSIPGPRTNGGDEEQRDTKIEREESDSRHTDSHHLKRLLTNEESASKKQKLDLEAPELPNGDITAMPLQNRENKGKDSVPENVADNHSEQREESVKVDEEGEDEDDEREDDDEIEEESDNKVSYNNVEVEQADMSHNETKGGENDLEDAENVDVNEQRKLAIQELISIEKSFAELRDKLFQDKLNLLERELQLCLEGSHPELSKIYHKINQFHQKNLRQVNSNLNYRLRCIDIETVATRTAIHQNFLRKLMDCKHSLFTQTTSLWYKINKERNQMDLLVPEYNFTALPAISSHPAHYTDELHNYRLQGEFIESIPLTKKEVKQNMLHELVQERNDYNHELGILNGLFHFYGIPSSSSNFLSLMDDNSNSLLLKKATEEEINDDLLAMGIGI